MFLIVGFSDILFFLPVDSVDKPLWITVLLWKSLWFSC